MTFKRKIDDRLAAWQHRQSRKPLILRGARQVGKSFAVRQFAKSHFAQFATVNFEERPDLKAIFAGPLSSQKILPELELALGTSILPGSTLLFFDEVQECPNALKAMRYLYEQRPALHVVAAGSLLEFTIENIGVPVGRVEFDWLYPMCFSEFLSATNRGHLISHLPRATTQPAEWPKAASAVPLLDRALQEYLIVGGMPEVVAQYVATGSFLVAEQTQDSIMTAFTDDTRKYARGDLQIANLQQVMRRIFRFVGQEITYSSVIEGENSQRTANSILLLEKAMLIHLVRSASPAGLPLESSSSDKHFKAVFLDVGLGRRLGGYSANDVLNTDDLLRVCDGRLAEQFVGQQLLAESDEASEQRKLFCWIRPKRTAKAEVDYLLARNGNVHPVEVKSGTGGRLRSLAVLTSEYRNVTHPICLKTTGQIKEHRGIKEMPLYTIL